MRFHRLLAFLLANLAASSVAHAQGELDPAPVDDVSKQSERSIFAPPSRDIFEGGREEQGPVALVALEGDDRALELRRYEGMSSAGYNVTREAYRTTNSSGQTTIYSTTGPRMLRSYSTLGRVGEVLPMPVGVYELSLGGLIPDSNFHDARAYRVRIDEDVTALRLEYINRRPFRIRAGIIASLLAVAGGVMAWASVTPRFANPDGSANLPLMITGGTLAGSITVTLPVFLLSRDHARIDVVHRDGRVVRARDRISN
jgi:hypothetical protein